MIVRVYLAPDGMLERSGCRLRREFLEEKGVGRRYFGKLVSVAVQQRQAFKETGNIFNKDVAARFEKEILSKGGTRDPLDMYIAFRGKEPGIEALLVKRGLK